MGKRPEIKNKTQPEHLQDWKTIARKLENIPFGTFANTRNLL